MTSPLDTLAKRMRFAREARGLSQEALAQQVGMRDASGISKIESGTQFATRKMGLIAEALGCRVSWLEHGTGSRLARGNALSHDPSATDNLDGADIDAQDAEDVTLYQYADPRAPGGPYSGRSSAPELPVIHVSAAILVMLGMDRADAIGHRQEDDSMAPTINARDEGIIDRSQREPGRYNGRIFAFGRGSTVMLRRAVESASGRLTLICDNSDKTLYPDEHFEPEEAAKLHIIGRLRYSGGEK